MRYQVYVPEDLEEILVKEAGQAGVNVPEIIIKVLREKYEKGDNCMMDYIAFKEEVFKEIEKYVSEIEIGTEFELSEASKTFREIPMTKDGKPNIYRAKLGRLFGQSIGKKPFENIERVYLANGNVKKSTYNKATMFVKVK